MLRTKGYCSLRGSQQLSHSAFLYFKGTSGVASLGVGRGCQLASKVKSATFRVINPQWLHPPDPSPIRTRLHAIRNGYRTMRRWRSRCVVVNLQIVTPLPSPTLLTSRESATKLELGSLFAEGRTLVFRLKLKSVAVAVGSPLASGNPISQRRETPIMISDFVTPGGPLRAPDWLPWGDLPTWGIPNGLRLDCYDSIVWL
jgi:hypothetical protein